MARMTEDKAVGALGALAQASRLNVFRKLVVAGPEGLYPGELAADLGVLPNSLSFHLKELQRCGLVTQQREGRFLRYRADMTQMQSLMDFLLDQCCQGQPCVDTSAATCKPVKVVRRKAVAAR
jgi:ArsR family transcriptional regulator